MQVVEKFVSINGEGEKAGEASVFIRFKGCNLDCEYCDTTWVNKPDCEYEEMDAGALIDYVLETGIYNVTVTGGEPLLQKDMVGFISDLCDTHKKSVEIETNGSIDIKPFTEIDNCSVTMDYKLPTSGCEDMMHTDNFGYLRSCDTVKFVVGSRDDLECAAGILQEYQLTDRCYIYFSPVFDKIKPKDIAEFIIERKLNHVRLQLQLHKYIGMK